MYYLGIDTSTSACSCGILQDDKVICELNINNQKTHSTTLCLLIQQAFALTGLTLEQMDGIACVVGPGSFTGIRIGVCTAKGLAFGAEKPCYGIDTLDCLAVNGRQFAGTVCTILDARREQVFGAAFEGDQKILEDFAGSLEEYLQKLEGKKTLFLGDGALAYREKIQNILPDAQFGEKHLCYPKASAACILAYEAGEKGAISLYDLTPHYLRKSQAERLHGHER